MTLAKKKKAEEFVEVKINNVVYQVTPGLPLSAEVICITARAPITAACTWHLGRKEVFAVNERGVVPQWGMCLHTTNAEQEI